MDLQQFHRQLPFTHSKDYLVLKKYHWLLLKNRDDIKYYTQPRMNYQLDRLMNTYDYEDWLYRIDSNFEDIRELKEKYITFNRCFLQEIIPKSCIQKWRTLHLHFGESCMPPDWLAKAQNRQYCRHICYSVIAF